MDSELVVRAQQGDQAAFVALMGHVAGRLERLAVGILRERELAEDAVQSALLTIWRHLPTLRDPERFEAWACRVLVRQCHQESRRGRRWIPGLPAWTPDARSGDVDRPDGPAEPTVPDGLAAVADRDQLERGFRRLSLDQRAVLVLRLYLDLPPEQVAEALGIPVGTVHSRLHRALRAMRASLEADLRAGATDRTAREVAP